MSVQRTVTMSDAFWQRILDAPGDVPLDENQDPVMSQADYAKKWVFDVVKKAVEKAEFNRSTKAIIKLPVEDDDFVIE